MLQSSFMEIGPPVLEIFEGFLPYMGVAASWSCGQDPINKLSFPLQMEAPHKISTFGQAVSEKIFEIVDDD